ncbi:MAG: patatin-like phospholipase family protein [Mariniphaga sp.]|nr:patatin-like phospholipase family protein [Mariniphaga sp.]MDD4225765.1 patatin-like phospholipase family protein [Mariniphaga sp.]
MTYKDFTKQTTFQKLVTEAEKLRKKTFSDIIDSAGHQYVDLVQEGGGVLGIALVGYTYILEAAGIRFFHLAGTSAGAINTLLLAGIDTMEKAKSKRILDELARQDLLEFIDGEPAMQKICRCIICGTSGLKLVVKLIWYYRKVKKALVEKMGMNPGNKMEEWIETILRESPNRITTLGELLQKRKKMYFPNGLRNRITGEPVRDEEAKIHLVTADITTQTRVLFPQMARLYWGERAETISPAKMVRASISIPFFFVPFEIDHIPGANTPAGNEWIKHAHYFGPIPRKVKFVDGGLISNFPIKEFHTPAGIIPEKPTFGVKLSSYRNSCARVGTWTEFIASLVSTMRHDADYLYLLQNPDYRKLICFIDADKDYHWLHFNMNNQKKKELFLLGARKGLDFIQNFNWEGYKKLRKETSRLSS